MGQPSNICPWIIYASGCATMDISKRRQRPKAGSITVNPIAGPTTSPPSNHIRSALEDCLFSGQHSAYAQPMWSLQGRTKSSLSFQIYQPTSRRFSIERDFLSQSGVVRQATASCAVLHQSLAGWRRNLASPCRGWALYPGPDPRPAGVPCGSACRCDFPGQQKANT
jgi:hypothetical protein